jgi:hypothetical protein
MGVFSKYRGTDRRHAAGSIKRGSSGIIGTNRADAVATVQSLCWLTCRAWIRARNWAPRVCMPRWLASIMSLTREFFTYDRQVILGVLVEFLDPKGGK